MSLARLLGSAAITRMGSGLIRRGLAMRDARQSATTASKQARVRSVITGVQARTRGLSGNPRKFSKLTAVGQQRRLDLASRIRARRAGVPPVTKAGKQFAAELQARRAKQLSDATRAKVKQTHYLTRQRFKSGELNKRNKSGRLMRGMLAYDLRKARKGQYTSSLFGRKGGGTLVLGPSKYRKTLPKNLP